MSEQKTNPFDYVKSITETKDNLLRGTDNDEMMIGDYVPFLTMSALSFFPDTVLFANDVNQYPELQKRAHYEYLLNTIKPRKRYGGKWPKSQRDSTTDLIMDVYNVGLKKAEIIRKLLSEKQLEQLRDSKYEGGQNKTM